MGTRIIHLNLSETVVEEVSNLDVGKLCLNSLSREISFRVAAISLSSIQEPQTESNSEAKQSPLRALVTLAQRVSSWKPLSWETRLPFFGDASAEEALSALNHVYAGTAARTLSQVRIWPTVGY